MRMTESEFRELERRLASKERRAAIPSEQKGTGCVCHPMPPVSSVAAKPAATPEPSMGLASLMPELQFIHTLLSQVKTIRRVVVRVKPMGAPRQSRRDVWQPRECVLRYRDLRDAIRAAAGDVDPNTGLIVAKFFLPVTPSWGRAKQERAIAGGFHKMKPDTDNLYKAFSDAMLPQDGVVHSVLAYKRWCPAGDERIEATLCSF